MHGYYGSFYNGFLGLGRYQYGGYIMMGIGVIVIIALVYLAVRRGNSYRPSGSQSHETPLETLQKRYINGEISKEEFMEKQEILKRK